MTECSRCGECCRYLVIGKEKELNADQRRYLIFRGAEFHQGLVMIFHPCHCLKYIWADTGNIAGVDEMTSDRLRDGIIIAQCCVHNWKPEMCRLYKGKKITKGIHYYIPERCRMKP